MVICHGNICRSPFAERRLALCCPQLEVRSAGLAAGGDDPVQPGALRIGTEFGVDLSDHISHRLDADDIEWADLILGMQGRHEASVRQRWPLGRPKMRLLGDFLPSVPHEIEDPWGETDEVFRSVFERISLATVRIGQILNEEHEGRPYTTLE